MSGRQVVLLCGPPGAGKSTIARESGLVVYDRDDPWWSTEKDFKAALAALRHDQQAQAVVIRSGATSSARRKAAGLIGATHTFVLMAAQAELRERVGSRSRADMVFALASISGWFDSFDRSDGVADFPGWSAIGAGVTPKPVRAPSTTPAPRSKGRTGRPWRRLQARVYRTETVCGICGKPVDMTLPWPHPLSKSVDHKEAISRGGAVRDRLNVQLAHLGCNSGKKDGAAAAEVSTSRVW